MRMLAVVVAVTALVFVAAGVGAAQYNYGNYGPPQPQAQGPDVKGQLKTAITHAGFAAGGNALGYVEQHLGHALNCIEGPKGKNFNQSWGNVCEGMGGGIMVDLKAAPGGAALIPDAEKADNLAVAGLKTKNLDEAKKAAQGVSDILTGISGKLK